jgi:hypothetical protein
LTENTYMRRRRILFATFGVVATAGCIGNQTTEEPPANQSEEERSNNQTEDEQSDEGTKTEANEPIYDPAEKDALIPPAETFPDDWRRNDEQNEEFEAVFINENGTIAVLIEIGVAESVEEAREAFEDSKALYRDPQDLDIGDEAFWDTRDSQARTYFRHSNAIGVVRAVRQTGIEIEPDVSRSQNYAFDMFNHWKSVNQ